MSYSHEIISMFFTFENDISNKKNYTYTLSDKYFIFKSCCFVYASVTFSHLILVKKICNKGRSIRKSRSYQIIKSGCIFSIFFSFKYTNIFIC